MPDKEIYCMGRAEYLLEYEGFSLIEGYKKAELEYDESLNYKNKKGDEYKI